MYLGSWKIDDYLPIPVTCHQFSTGAAYAPTVLTYSIYEDATTVGLDENVDMVVASPFDSVVGFYLARRQLTAAAGFEQGKNYTVLVKATVDGVAAIQSHTFQIRADTNSNVTQWLGTACATPATAGYPVVTHKVGTGTGELSITTGTVTTGAISNGAITAAAISTDAIDADALAADALVEIKAQVTSALADIDLDHIGKTGSAPAVASGSYLDKIMSKTAGGVTYDQTTDSLEAIRDAAAIAPTNFSSMSVDSSGRVLLQPVQTGVTIPTVTAVTNEVTADITKISGDATAADNAELFFDGTGYAGTNNVIPTVTTVTDVTTKTGYSLAASQSFSTSGSVGSVAGNVTGSVASVAAAVTTGTISANAINAAAIASDAITAAKIATGAITAAKFAAGAIDAAAIATGAIDADALASDACAEIFDYTALAFGTCQAGSTYNNIILATTASSVNDYYNRCLVSITSGLGAGQARLIADYVGSTRTAVIDNPWVTAPDATSIYRVISFSGILLADTGLAAAATSSSITLAASAPAVADTFVGHTVFICGGIGIGQARLITEYTNIRVATVSPNWSTTPDATSIYKVLPVGQVKVNQMTDGSVSSSTFAAGAINAAAIADDAIDLAAFADDAIPVTNPSVTAAVLAGVIEGTVTVKQSLQLANAANAAKTDGMGAAGTVHLRDLSDSKNRITAIVDDSGNRTAVTPSYD